MSNSKTFSNEKAKSKSQTKSLVSSKIIMKSTFLSARPKEWQPHMIPSLLIYLGWYYFKINFEIASSETFGWFFFILACSIHALLFLIPQWSIEWRASWLYKTESVIANASDILIVPTENNGQGAICALEKGFQDSTFFLFQKKKFVWDSDKKIFKKLEYLHHEGHPFSFFTKSHLGLKKQDISNELGLKYGKNTFDVPIPSFMSLFKEHLVAPFFVFQIFCVCLWFLDDMWYFSLFTLFMLFVFESTVVFQRLKNLQEFRAMSIAPYPLYVYRDKKWKEIMTDELLPGDVCSIIRQKDDHPIAADFVLVNGSCIANEAMLSGESTPQLKEPAILRDETDILKISSDKINILFGGTKILQVTPPASDSLILSPDGGCIATVLRTGFATQQGKLVRTIIYSTERVTANNAESLFFILFLLFFAIIASYYVWTTASREDDRDQTKLLLHCIMIITSVVPPELPMELSMAVNNSLASLAKAFVFCTEPFRIPFSGRIDVACFDKTGTLTAENLVVEGISGAPGTETSGIEGLVPAHECPIETRACLASAHALVVLSDEGVIGDPMEKNTLEAIKWAVTKGDRVAPLPSSSGSNSQSSKGGSLQIIRRFPFSSALKRMSTVSYRQSHPTAPKQVWVACKGAPETLKHMFENVPADYDEHYKTWARRGKRVLALGYKTLSNSSSDVLSVKDIRELHRGDVESGLTFGGFLIFWCPLKEDSVDAIRMLNESSHRTVMITGDNALTACHIAKEVEIVKRHVLIADEWVTDSGVIQWKTVDEKVTVPLDVRETEIPSKLKAYDLCVTGPALALLASTNLYKTLLPRIWVYARVSPSQKEYILMALKDAGYCTLMCGDGTNDVGALKQAHVGIALLDGTVEGIQKIQAREMALRKKMILQKQEEMKKRWGIPDPATGKPGTPTISEMLEQVSTQLEEEGDVPTIKFGDASVAAPFTSKISSVMSVCSIVRQGRATLVALTQMYKILALNSLIMAYSLSVLHIAGIKQGDWQATVAGMLITICFFGLAKSTALEKLSPERPQPNIFNAYIIISVLGQSLVHVLSLIYIQAESRFYSEVLDEVLPIDAPFSPNLLNSGVYLVSLIMQISTFAINYQGLPFRESIVQNKAMFNSLCIVSFIAFAAGAELFDELNSIMQLVPFPPEFRVKLLATMALDFGIAWLIETVCWYFFSNNRPQKSLFPNDKLE